MLPIKTECVEQVPQSSNSRMHTKKKKLQREYNCSFTSHLLLQFQILSFKSVP